MNRLMTSLAVAASLACTASFAQDGTGTEAAAEQPTNVCAQERTDAFATMLGLNKEERLRTYEVFAGFEAQMVELYAERDAVAARIDEMMAGVDAKVLEMLGDKARATQEALLKSGEWQPSLVCCDAATCAGHAQSTTAAGCAGHASAGAAGTGGGCCAGKSEAPPAKEKKKKR